MASTSFAQLTEILSRAISAVDSMMSRAVSQAILGLGFSEFDINRMNEFAAKARLAELDATERSLLDAYLCVGSLVDLMHSKARLALKK